MTEKLCNWCGIDKATSGLKNGEQHCKTCDPYAWAAFKHPEHYEENKRIALMRVERRLLKAEQVKAEQVASEWKSSPPRRWVERKELVAARIAFVGMFLAVLVAVYGMYLVGGKC